MRSVTFLANQTRNDMRSVRVRRAEGMLTEKFGDVPNAEKLPEERHMCGCSGPGCRMALLTELRRGAAWKNGREKLTTWPIPAHRYIGIFNIDPMESADMPLLTELV